MSALGIVTRGLLGDDGSGDDARVITAEVSVELTGKLDVAVERVQYDIAIEVCDEDE